MRCVVQLTVPDLRTEIVQRGVDRADVLFNALDKFDAFKASKGEEGVIDPEALAETYWHLAQQPKNCWTHEVDARPWADVAWWNDNPSPAINSTAANPGFSGPKT